MQLNFRRVIRSDVNKEVLDVIKSLRERESQLQSKLDVVKVKLATKYKYAQTHQLSESEVEQVANDIAALEDEIRLISARLNGVLYDIRTAKERLRFGVKFFVPNSRGAGKTDILQKVKYILKNKEV